MRSRICVKKRGFPAVRVAYKTDCHDTSVINLGIICTRMGDGGRWYLKKTIAGDAFLTKNGIKLETGIKGNSYIITDFSNIEILHTLVKITRDEIIKNKNK